MTIARHLVLGLTSLSLFAAYGCSAAGTGNEEEGQDVQQAGRDPIVGGTKASGYTEAVLIDMAQGGQIVAACSGALIAPQVVLTAGHCVVTFDGWQVRAPFAGNQTATASNATTLDYNSTQEYVDANAHDVGLIFLDSPITLSSYPTIATSPVGSGQTIVNIGRINNGTLSNTALYASSPISVSLGTNQGFPYDYVATDKIESGDSGGPDVITGTHTIVAVNSGAGGGTEVLARVDLVASWIQNEIAAHGGSGPSNGAGGSSGGGGTSSAGGSSTSAGGSSSSGGTCSHKLCRKGSALKSSCDPCVTDLCAYDPYCCTTAWDKYCVAEVTSVCGESCP